MGRHQLAPPQAADIATPFGRRRALFLVDLPNQSVELCQVHVRVSDAENQVQAIPADRHTCTQQAVEGLGDESLLLEPLRSEYAVVLVVDVDAYEPGVLNQPSRLRVLNIPLGVMHGLRFLIRWRTFSLRSRNAITCSLNLAVLTPLYQVNIAVVLVAREVVPRNHGNPD